MKRKFKRLLKQEGDILSEINRYNVALSTLHTSLQDIRNEIKSSCEHTDTIKKTIYKPGDYYNRSVTTTHDECIHCGWTLNHETDYGSFG